MKLGIFVKAIILLRFAQRILMHGNFVYHSIFPFTSIRYGNGVYLSISAEYVARYSREFKKALVLCFVVLGNTYTATDDSLKG